MKKLLILLFSLFFLSSSSVFADDISDFEIEGMSIGDSLLDYLSEGEILERIEHGIDKNSYFYLKEPNKFIEIYLRKEFPTYDDVSVFVKNNSTSKYLTNKNEKYIILALRGFITYIEDHNSCIQKRDEIIEDLSKMFPNVQRRDELRTHRVDPSGNSITDGIDFSLDSGGVVDAQCSNYEENFRILNKYSEGFSITVVSAETIRWFKDK